MSKACGDWTSDHHLSVFSIWKNQSKQWNVEIADKLWNKWASAASGHKKKKRLISCPWVCCWCAAWAQHSSRLKCENNVGRCAFDPTEWHLPGYPWDGVVKHCKDLLLPHLWRKKQQLTKAEWMLGYSTQSVISTSGGVRCVCYCSALLPRPSAVYRTFIAFLVALVFSL